MKQKIISEQDFISSLPPVARMIPDEIWKDMFNSLPSAQGDEYDEDAAKRLRAILSMLGIAAPESDEQMMLCQFSLFGMMRRKISDLYTSTQLPPDAAARIAELEALSVTNIMLKVVPDENGHGAEIYAKSVTDVEKVLTDMGLTIEDYELGIKIPPGASSRIASLESENAKLKADMAALVEALGEADELIAIEPFEHVAEEAAESHRNIRALLSNLRGGE